MTVEEPSHRVGIIYVANALRETVSTYGKTRWMAFTSKMCEKHLWKSDILSKDAGHRPASLCKMSVFHRRFSHILLVKTNYLVSP